jgi:hypothetical protein
MAKDLWIAWPTGSGNEETRSVLIEEYRDHGAWARHYSTVRMTLGTFFVTAATSIIYLRWDTPECRTLVLAALTLLIGIGLFLWFSMLTFKKMNDQLVIVASYRTALGKPERAPEPLRPIWRGEPVCICATILVLFAIIGWLWLYGPRRPSHTVEFKIPIAVQVGETPAVSVQVPVKVTVPAKTDH